LRADAPDDSLTSKSDPAWQAPRVARTGMPTALAF